MDLSNLFIYARLSCESVGYLLNGYAFIQIGVYSFSFARHTFTYSDIYELNPLMETGKHPEF